MKKIYYNNFYKNSVLGYFIAIMFAFVAHWSYLKFVNSRLFLILILFFSFIHMQLTNRNILVKFSNMHSLFFIVCLLNYIQLIYSPNIYGGLIFTLQITMAFLISIIVLSEKRLIYPIYNILFISSLICVIFVIFQMFFYKLFDLYMFKLLKTGAYISAKGLEKYGYMTGLSGFSGIAGFVSSCCLGIFIINLYIDYGLYHSQRYFILLPLLGIFLSFFALVMTQKRGIIFAVGCAFLFSFFVFNLKYKKKHFFQVFAFSVIILIIIYYIFTNTKSGHIMINRFKFLDNFSSGRFDMWETLLEKINGIGWFIGNGTGATTKIFDSGGHNIYLQILFDNGLVGLFLYLLWFITSLFRTIKLILINKGASKLLYISLYIQILFLGYGMFGNPIYDFCLFIIYIFFVTFAYYPKGEYI